MRRPVSYPTPAEINALPEPLRCYVRDLETRCDPAGDLQRIAALELQNAALVGLVERLKGVQTCQK